VIKQATSQNVIKAATMRTHPQRVGCSGKRRSPLDDTKSTENVGTLCASDDGWCRGGFESDAPTCRLSSVYSQQASWDKRHVAILRRLFIHRCGPRPTPPFTPPGFVNETNFGCKGKGIVHIVRVLRRGCAVKTIWSLDNACNISALLGWSSCEKALYLILLFGKLI